MRIDLEIDRLCDEFEQSWKSGAAPEISGYIERISATARLALLGQLVPVDLEYRLGRGELPKADDYAQAGVDAVEVAERELKKLEASGRLSPKVSNLLGSAVDMDAATLPPVGRSDSADEFATVNPVNKDEDATIVPPVDDDATLMPVRESQSTASAGTRVRYFGDYELLSEIARGGMGVVYKARQVNLNRVVALKMILAGQLASEEEVQRFRTEAEAAANLDHPGIVPIYEIGQHEGQHFFSMGYVDGCSLADRVRNGPLPPKEAAELTKKIAEAIAFAHSRNVIHRDLKPANVLLDQNGEPKVTDFGLARKTDNDSGMTRTGAVMGTPSYMPPEQAAGKTSEVGPLSDVYSLGAILYCLLTGRPPFQAANPLDTLLQVMEREPVSVSTINPEIQRDLETICHKALQKEPAKRYASAQELADDLGRWLRREPIQARAVSNTERAYRWVRRNQLVSGLTAVTALALLIGAVVSILFGIAAEKEATNARVAESEARDAEAQAKQSKATAVASQEKTEATLARSNYFLAQARWDDNRVADAFDLLQTVPQKHRRFEWYLARNQFDQSQFGFYGHTQPVNSVSFSPDGLRIASGDGDIVSVGEIKLWDASTGTELLTFTGHNSAVTCVMFSPDGTCLASGSADGTARLWDVSTGTELAILAGHLEGVTSISFNPDGTRLVSGSADGTTKLWDVSTGTELAKLAAHQSGVTSVSFSPDGTRVASAGRSGEIKLLDALTGDEVTSLHHNGGVSSVSFSPDGMRIASGSANRTLKIWEISTRSQVYDLIGHEQSITSVSFSPDGSRLASGAGGVFGQTGEIKLWDASAGTELKSLKGHECGVTSVNFSPDGSRLVSGAADLGHPGEVKLWDASTGIELNTLEGHTDLVNCLSFSPDSTRIASGSSDKTIKIWDTSLYTEIMTVESHARGVTSLSFSPDGMLLAAGSYAGTIEVLNASTGAVLTSMSGHTGVVNCVSFSPAGTRVVSGSGDSTIKLWDAQTGTELTTLRGHQQGVNSVSFSPDGTLIASGSDDGTIRIWSAVTLTEVINLTRHEIGVTCVCFSPDGSSIVSGDDVGTLKFWNSSTGKELMTLKGHFGRVVSVGFSPDGTRIASGGRDKMIKIWDAFTGTELSTLMGHQYPLTSVCFSGDGTCLASGSFDGTLKIWDATSAVEQTKFKGFGDYLSGVSFSDDGTQLLASDSDGQEILWNVQTGERNLSRAPLRRSGSTFSFPTMDRKSKSANGRWMALEAGPVVQLVDLTFKESLQERTRRMQMAQPKPSWHMTQMRVAQSELKYFQAMFHAAWLMKISPSDAWCYDDLQDCYQWLVGSNQGQIPPLPRVASEMLKAKRGNELPQLNEAYARLVNQQIANLVKRSEVAGALPVSNWPLQRMKDVCTRFPRGVYFHTLGLAQYRAGEFEPAIGSFQKSMELSPAELEASGVSPVDLGFTAMCHHRLGNTAMASEYRNKTMTAASEHLDSVLNPEFQAILSEMLSTLEGPESVVSVSSPDDFQREGTFEAMFQHHWRIPDSNFFTPEELDREGFVRQRRWFAYASINPSFILTSEDPHSGKACLQVRGGFDATSVHQSVAVSPNSRYRLTGWIRSQLEMPALDDSSDAIPQDPLVETATPAIDSPALGGPAVGACFAILNREETSEIVTGTTDWKQITWEFTTRDETTITLNCQVGGKNERCEGTAWFDDLKLEKVE